ncbi:MAG: hypothetical protein GY711_27385 [bacterium]|nr:hypothetical protein [bacterium]
MRPRPLPALRCLLAAQLVFRDVNGRSLEVAGLLPFARAGPAVANARDRIRDAGGVPAAGHVIDTAIEDVCCARAEPPGADGSSQGVRVTFCP